MIFFIKKLGLVGSDPMMQFVSFDPSDSNHVNPMPAGKRGVSSMRRDTPACNSTLAKMSACNSTIAKRRSIDKGFSFV